MRCPRCETSALDERDRDGITVDVCRTCRGVWLDRGELEKLMARASRELDEFDRSYRQEPPRYEQPRMHGGKRDSTPPKGTPRYDDRHHHGHKRKRSWLDSFGDIFD